MITPAAGHRLANFSVGESVVVSVKTTRVAVTTKEEDHDVIVGSLGKECLYSTDDGIFGSSVVEQLTIYHIRIFGVEPTDCFGIIGRKN